MTLPDISVYNLIPRGLTCETLSYLDKLASFLKPLSFSFYCTWLHFHNTCYPKESQCRGEKFSCFEIWCLYVALAVLEFCGLPEIHPRAWMLGFKACATRPSRKSYSKECFRAPLPYQRQEPVGGWLVVLMGLLWMLVYLSTDSSSSYRQAYNHSTIGNITTSCLYLTFTWPG